MKILTVLTALFCFLASAVVSLDLKPEHVAVIYNENSADGRVLAEKYAELRNIPSENIVALSCSQEESISRSDYNKTIREPLKRAAVQKKWWVSAGGASLPVIHGRRIFVLVPIKGIPLKIVNDPVLKKAGINTDAAAVDSELALLAIDGVPTPGMIGNAYYGKNESIVGSGFPYFLVSRIDAPDRETCMEMMHDAVDVEKRGLWGWLVVDKGGPYAQGNEWMDKIVKRGEEAGIPVILDEWGATLPSHYPLGNDAALYFGWYIGHANGPFLAKSFRFKRGAIAAHIQSFSASTVRSVDKFWVGPLLTRGAAVTVGNVFEPYLDTSHHLDMFFDRLVSGYTVAEAAGMSIRVWSWQNVVFGDPLYRPFARNRGNEEKRMIKSEGDKYFQAWSLAFHAWGSKPEKLKGKLIEAASLSSGSMFFYEALGNRSMIKKNWKEANVYFAKALVPAFSMKDRIRIRMSLADSLRRMGDKKRCLDELNALRGLYPKTEWTPAFEEIRNRVQPPHPKPKPPQTKAIQKKVTSPSL